jgi:hypothetical protein
MMRKLKSLLTEQFEVKKLVIKTPAPKSILAITDNIKPDAIAFVVKATESTGETPDLNVIKTAISMNSRFGTTSIWARISKDPYVYILGPDLKDSSRKLFFNVMVVPMSWIYDQILGADHDESLESNIGLFNDTTFKIGNASLITQSEFDAEINKFKTSTKSPEEKTQASATQNLVTTSLKDPSAGNSIDTAPDKSSNKDTYGFGSIEWLTIDRFNKTFPNGITLAEFSKPSPGELVYKSIGAIQELMYQIGMKNPAMNSIKEWVTFKDARPDYGTAYGTRTSAFVKYLNKAIFNKDSNTLGSDLYEKLLEYKSKLNITESFIKLMPLINEQDLGFPVEPEQSSFPVIDLPKASDNKTNATKVDNKSVTAKVDLKKRDAATNVVKQELQSADIVKGKLKNKFTLNIKSNPNNAIINWDLDAGTDLIFNPKTKTWLIYPKNYDTYGYHIFKYKMGSNIYTYVGKGSGQAEATWQSNLSKYLNSENYVNSLKSVYTTSDPEKTKQLNTCLSVAKDLSIMTTVNPNKYFWKYRHTVTKDPEPAAKQFATLFNEKWGTKLEKLTKSSDKIIVDNVNKINSVANSLYRIIKTGNNSKPYELSITNPENKQVTTFKIHWTYLNF